MSWYRGKQKEGSLNWLVKGIKEKKEGGEKPDWASRGELCIENGRIQLSLHPALPRDPSFKRLRPSPTTVASPGCFHLFSFIQSFIHSSIFFPLLGRSKPTNYHQLPPDGLCPCSCFSWPFKQPCINKPVVTNQKGGERLLFKAPPVRKRERGRGSPRFTPRESKSAACHF